MKTKKFDKSIFKKTGDELQDYLQFQRRASRVENKKGKSSYTRKIKHKGSQERDCA